MNKSVAIILGVLILIIAVMGFLFYRELTKPKLEVIPKYELLITRVDQLDSLVRMDYDRLTSLQKQSVEFTKKYNEYKKISVDTIVVDSTEFLRNLTRFTDSY